MPASHKVEGYNDFVYISMTIRGMLCYRTLIKFSLEIVHDILQMQLKPYSLNCFETHHKQHPNAYILCDFLEIVPATV